MLLGSVSLPRMRAHEPSSTDTFFLDSALNTLNVSWGSEGKTKHVGGVWSKSNRWTFCWSVIAAARKMSDS